jgi:hypothetical protein
MRGAITPLPISLELHRDNIFFNYLLKVTIYSMYSIQGKSYKIFPVINLTEMSTWTKSYTEGKIKIRLVKKTRKKTLCLMVSWFTVVNVSVVYVYRFYLQSSGGLVYNYLFVGQEG